MFISTNSILSFTTTLAIFQVAFGQPQVQRRADVNHVWTLANGDISPVSATSNMNNTTLELRNHLRMATLALPFSSMGRLIILFVVRLTDPTWQSVPWSYHYGEQG